MPLKEVLAYLPQEIRLPLSNLEGDVLRGLSEIRIRKGLALVLTVRGKAFFISKGGYISREPDESSLIISEEVFDKTVMRLCDYSFYSVAESLKEGYITLKNGARIGTAGRAVYEKSGIINVNEITSLNIRIPRAVKGCADSVLEALYKDSLTSIIVAGRPASGKTTLLRDMAVSLSGGIFGRYSRVCIVDERLELAGDSSLIKGAVNCDVLRGFPKEKGIEMAVRTLSPDIIICDEVGTVSEAQRILQSFSSGVSFALSVHAGSKEDLFRKPIVKRLLGSGEFSAVVWLDGDTYNTVIIKGDFCESCRSGDDNPLNNIDRRCACTKGEA